MDLRFIADAEPTASERAALDARARAPAVELGGRRAPAPAPTATPPAGGHEARARRHLLLPALWALQERVGWISPGGLNEICRRLTVPPADAYGVATFYALLRARAAAARASSTCARTSRAAATAREELIAQLEERFGREGELVGRRLGDLVPEPVPRAVRPRARGDDLGRGRASRSSARWRPSTRGRACSTSSPVATRAVARRRRCRRRATRRCGCCAGSASRDPASLDDYRAHGGYAGAAPRVRARPRGRAPRGEGLEAASAAAAPRSRPASSGRPSPASPPARTTSSATPTSPSRGRSRTAC